MNISTLSLSELELLAAKMKLSNLSLADLKVRAREIGAVPTGDRRSKQSWIDAIVLAESALEQTPIALVEVAEPAPTPKKVLNRKSLASVIAIELQQDSGPVTINSDRTPTQLQQTPESIAPQIFPLSEELLPRLAALSEELPNIQHPTPNKKGAIAVLASLLVFALSALHAIIGSTCIALRGILALVRVFGKYDPDLDPWYLLHSSVERQSERLSRTGGDRPIGWLSP